MSCEVSLSTVQSKWVTVYEDESNVRVQVSASIVLDMLLARQCSEFIKSSIPVPNGDQSQLAKVKLTSSAVMRFIFLNVNASYGDKGILTSRVTSVIGDCWTAIKNCNKHPISHSSNAVHNVFEHEGFTKWYCVGDWELFKF